VATFAAVFAPKSQTGGLSDNQQAVLAASGTANITVGVRQKIRISVGATTPAATGVVAIRFSFGANSTAAATDFQLPSGVFDFETGEEFDRVNLFGVVGCVISVMRLQN
jgi:hypothetical protein